MNINVKATQFGMPNIECISNFPLTYKKRKNPNPLKNPTQPILFDFISSIKLHKTQ